MTRNPTLRITTALLAWILLAPVDGAAQGTCGVPIEHPAGATCSGGSQDGWPCYVFDTGDAFGCPGGTCVANPGGGRATFYNASTGACGIPVNDPQAMVAAVAEYLWDGSAICGRCAKVTGPLGTVIVQVTDMCPVVGNEQWCSGDAAHLDLSDAAFAAIADPVRGVTWVDWEIVECPVGQDNITVMNKDGINVWWYAMFALDLRHGVDTVEVKDSSIPQWVSAERQPYNAFVVTGGPALVLPLSVRLTDVFGNTVTSTDVVTDLVDSSQFDAGEQFPACSLFADGFENGTLSAWSQP